ncbi:MAG: hypothetical protein M9952_09160 [Microthrixaceae bacterium]|nr:hypothetical protein [Microthrixaceae bacterium]
MSTTGAEGDSERRVIDAARERRSARIERDEAAAETSFCGLLSALVERRERVTLLTDVGDTVALALVALGSDGVVGRRDDTALVLLHADAILAITSEAARVHASNTAPTNDSGPPWSELVATSLAAGMNATVRRGAVTIAGEVESVGRDVVTLVRSDGRTRCYVSVASLTEVVSDSPAS